MSELEIQRDMQTIKSREADSARGWSALSLCIASIVEIHWEEMRCTLEILAGNGTDTRALTGVELLLSLIHI